MLQSKIRTPKEIEQYMREFKQWIALEREKPAETMANFFSNRIDCYETVHLSRWAEEYAHIADYFDSGLVSLLDLGVGTGLELKSILKRFPDVQVTGIDLSEDMLRLLHHNIPDRNVNTILADYTTYPFELESYQAVLAFETLHHFKAPLKQKIFEKIYKALPAGGYFIECDYIACSEEEEALCLALDAYKRKELGVSDSTFLHIDLPLTLSHELELLQNAGFQTLRVMYQNGSTGILRAQK